MRYSAIIWDFDGTLFDNYPFMAASAAGALARLGYRADTGEIMAWMRVSMATAVENCRDKYGVDPSAFADAYGDIIGATPPADVMPHEGVPEILAAVKARGGRNFIFTHRGESVRGYIAAHGLSAYFSDIVPGVGFARKPDPAGNLYIMAKHNLAPARVLAVGDREIDVLAAKNAGADACLFADYAPDAPPTAADYIINKIPQLSTVLGL